MQLSQKAIIDFKKIYFQKFGQELSDNEANERGLELLDFFKLIYKPIPKERVQKHGRRDKGELEYV